MGGFRIFDDLLNRATVFCGRRLTILSFSRWFLSRSYMSRSFSVPVQNTLDELKQRLRMEWTTLSLRQWRRRLSACVKAGGGHFLHHLWFLSLYCRC